MIEIMFSLRLWDLTRKSKLPTNECVEQIEATWRAFSTASTVADGIDNKICVYVHIQNIYIYRNAYTHIYNTHILSLEQMVHGWNAHSDSGINLNIECKSNKYIEIGVCVYAIARACSFPMLLVSAFNSIITYAFFSAKYYSVWRAMFTICDNNKQ